MKYMLLVHKLKLGNVKSFAVLMKNALFPKYIIFTLEIVSQCKICWV